MMIIQPVLATLLRHSSFVLLLHSLLHFQQLHSYTRTSGVLLSNNHFAFIIPNHHLSTHCSFSYYYSHSLMSKKITTATNDDDDDDNDDNDDKAIIISSTIPSNLKNQPSSSKDKNRQLLLWQWATHQHESFHNFNPDEATEIRQCLLEWYRANRRKLPWRGDAGPFDGSTAGINNGNGKKGTKRKIQGGVEKSNKGQKSIKSFFKEGDESSSSSSNKKKKKNKKKDEESVTRRRSARQRIKAESNEEDTATSCSSSTPMNSQGDVMISENKPIPMTGYSVWVSEIMLQQTRVEAVIPYYLKCKWLLLVRMVFIYDFSA